MYLYVIYGRVYENDMEMEIEIHFVSENGSEGPANFLYPFDIRTLVTICVFYHRIQITIQSDLDSKFIYSSFINCINFPAENILAHNLILAHNRIDSLINTKVLKFTDQCIIITRENNINS